MDSLADRFRGLDHLPVRVKLRRTQYEQMSSGLLLKADIDGVLARCEVKQCSDQTRACFKISLAPGANSLEHIAFDALDNARTWWPFGKRDFNAAIAAIGPSRIIPFPRRQTVIYSLPQLPSIAIRRNPALRWLRSSPVPVGNQTRTFR